jgi:hypothetical protein
MTSRMFAPHTTCPGCHEEVFLDELVRGRCPLCGCTLGECEDDHDDGDYSDRSDFSWLVFSFFIFRKFERLGVGPLRIMELISRCDSGEQGRGQSGFEFEVPMSFFDRVRPKRCTRCRKVFFTGGRKLITGELHGSAVTIGYLCGAACRPAAPDQ